MTNPYLNSVPEDSIDTVTVVIPTFNRANLLERAIRSVKKQTYQHWRLLVSDNASTDETSAVVSKFMDGDSRIRFHRHANNVGMLANWTSAISSVDSKFFCILSDDDVLFPDFMASVVTEMIKLPELGMCFGVTAGVNDTGTFIGFAPTKMAPGYYPAGLGASAMLNAQHPASTATLFRTASVQLAGGFDPKSHYVADLDMMLRVALMYPIKFFDGELAFHVAHADNAFSDDSCWYPGLRTLIINIRSLQPVDTLQQSRVLKKLSAHAITPFLASMLIRFFSHPIIVFNSKELRFALNCLVDTQHVGTALFQLPLIIFRRCASWFKRHIRKLLGQTRTNQVAARRHSRADDYFPSD